MIKSDGVQTVKRGAFTATPTLPAGQRARGTRWGLVGPGGAWWDPVGPGGARLPPGNTLSALRHSDGGDSLLLLNSWVLLSLEKGPLWPHVAESSLPLEAASPTSKRLLGSL